MRADTPIGEYRRRPDAGVLAAELHPIDAQEIAVWCGGELQDDSSIALQTEHGRVVVEVGDFVVRDVAGDFYPCSAKVFRRSYVAVTE
jgi:hypothetical protein